MKKNGICQETRKFGIFFIVIEILELPGRLFFLVLFYRQIFSHFALFRVFYFLLQDDITSSEDEQSCDESSNDENFIASSHEINAKPTTQSVTQKLPSPRLYNNEDKMMLQQQIQQQKMNEKLIDSQNKILLENLSNLPQNILQNLIQTGQLQLCTDDGEFFKKKKIPENFNSFLHSSIFYK
jgi:hypothetical protein